MIKSYSHCDLYTRAQIALMIRKQTLDVDEVILAIMSGGVSSDRIYMKKGEPKMENGTFSINTELCIRPEL